VETMTPRMDYQGALSDEQDDDGSNTAAPHEVFQDEETGSDRTIEKNSLEIDGSSSNEDDDDYTPPKASHKTIGKLGSYAIAVNALAGPGILQLPYTYQQAGIIPTTVALLLVGLISALCCMHTANVVSKVPGNSNFDKVIEFSDPYRIFWSRRAYYGTQIIFYLCTLCVNVAAIVDTAQIVDSFFGHSAMGTWGFSFDNGELQQWKHHKPCTRIEVKLGECSPFENDETGNIVLTLGYVITTVVFLPICLMDLKENTAWQIFGLIVLLSISLQFAICFTLDGLSTDNVTIWGESWSSMLGVILFNFGLVMAVPSWLAEKKDNVSVSRVVYGSTTISLVLYVSVGLLGALSIPNISPNALESMTSGAFGMPLRIGASIFAFVIIGLDIPLFSVLTRYNLVNSGLCSTRVANVFVVYLPWGLSWLFYQGTAISELLSWGGILFTGALAFLLPLYLAVRVLRIGEEDALEGSLVGGSVDVYLGFVKSKAAELKTTIILMAVSFACVLVAIIGQFYHVQQMQLELHKAKMFNATRG